MTVRMHPAQSTNRACRCISYPTRTSHLRGKYVLPIAGVYVHGLFIEGARWDFTNMCLTEPIPGELTSVWPRRHKN